MARLPIPGKDSGTWGDVLNDYLSQSLKSNGALKDNVVTNSAIAPDAITATEIQDGSILEAQLDSGVQTKLNATAPTWSTLSGKPTVIAAGSDAATARGVIDSAPSQGSSYYRNARVIPATNGTDDRATIQAILDEGPSEVIFRSGGTWTIDSTTGTGGLSPLSGTRIIIEDGATLKVKPNNNTSYRLIDIGRDGAVQNVTIEGTGTLLGDVLTHTGTTGEWGHLVHITNGSSNIVVKDINIKQAWGDGIYIGDGSGINSNVLIDGVIVDDCRREGIAPFWVNNCTIRNCRILNIALTAHASGGPSSGIDCEPNSGQSVDYLTIENNFVYNCSGPGIYVSSNPGPVTNVIIRDNHVIDCGITAGAINTYTYNGIHVGSMARPVLIDNVVKGSGTDNDHNGVSGQIYARQCISPIIKGGYLYNGLGRGIYLSDCSNPEVSNVRVVNSIFHGIQAYRCDGAVIRNNQVIDNVQGNSGLVEHISVGVTNNAVVIDNYLKGIKGDSWIKIETSGNDNLVANNMGVGATPTYVLVDQGTRTVKSGNFRKDTSIFSPMSADDAVTVGSSQATSFTDLLGWTYDPATILSGTQLSAVATAYFCRIPLRATTTVTNILVDLTTAGDTLTNSFVALYKSDGTILGQSTDQSTNWGVGAAVGLQTIPLSSPVVVTPTASNDFLWAAIYVGAATTRPTFARGITGNSVMLNAGASASRLRYGSLAVASTATLPSITPSSMAKASNSYWLALA